MSWTIEESILILAATQGHTASRSGAWKLHFLRMVLGFGLATIGGNGPNLKGVEYPSALRLGADGEPNLKGVEYPSALRLGADGESRVDFLSG